MANKLYKKGKVHPSPPPPSSVDGHLSLFLPASILILAAALSPQDKQVLAYLLSCSSNSTTHFRTAAINQKNDHAPMFECSCFRCYMSFWSRWDASPNREVIHEIIEAVEDYQDGLSKKRGGKQRRKKGRGFDQEGLKKDEAGKTAVEFGGGGAGNDGEVGDGNGGEYMEEVGVVKGLVGRIGSFIGDKIWGIWNTM